MKHPVIRRLTNGQGWPLLVTMEDVRAFTDAPGVHVLFVTGDPQRNVDMPLVAERLIALQTAFPEQFQCAVVDVPLQDVVRDATDVLKTPSLIFFRSGQQVDAIEKAQDFSEYMCCLTRAIDLPLAAE